LDDDGAGCFSFLAENLSAMHDLFRSSHPFIRKTLLHKIQIFSDVAKVLSLEI
jgi:hypothetical protein